MDVAGLAEALEAELARSQHGARLSAALGDRVLTHHKLAMAVSGCVNGCSEPQTKDFGVLGQARPEAVPGRCDGCRKCEKACREGAVKAGGPKGPSPDPLFAREKCLNCGDCARACAEGAISLTPGYRVVVGGRLGRHPRLAEVGAPGERIGTLLDRYGRDAVQARLEAASSRARTERRP